MACHGKLLYNGSRFSRKSVQGLQHTFATHALASGVDSKILSTILGHTKPSFTLDRYTTTTTEMQQKTADIMGGFLPNIMV